MLISKITIGDRVRKDMGDLRKLADSIARHGLMHPVVVKSDGTLVAGHRRIEAARLLGWTDIPATEVDVDDLLAAERDENAIRKAFTRSEAVAIGRLIEEEHRAKITATRSEMGRKGAAIREAKAGRSTGSIPQVDALGSTRAAAAKAVGLDESTYYKAKKVVTAAEADPKAFGDLPALMDETGNVSGTHREMERRREGAVETGPALKAKLNGSRRSPKRSLEFRLERAFDQLENAIDALESIATEGVLGRWAKKADALRARLAAVVRGKGAGL